MDFSATTQINERYGDDWHVVATITISRVGWEMDNEAWAVRLGDGTLMWLTTNHGGLIETTREDVRLEVDAMRKIVSESEIALNSVIE